MWTAWRDYSPRTGSNALSICSMARHRGPVLVDTNVILESHRVGAWRALAGGYRVETVEDCVVETQTGLQRRSPERRIDERELRDSLAAVHDVSDVQRTGLALRVADIALDRGEASLWAHALRRNDAWALCGPDTASLLMGVRLGFRDRLVSLQRLLADAGFPLSGRLRRHYTARWHEDTISGLIVSESPRTR